MGQLRIKLLLNFGKRNSQEDGLIVSILSPKLSCAVFYLYFNFICGSATNIFLARIIIKKKKFNYMLNTTVYFKVV